MARKALTKAAKEAVKRANQYMGGRPAGSPNKLSKALDKKTKAKTAPKAKAKPAKRGRPKGSTNKAKAEALDRQSKIRTAVTAQRRNARATKPKGTAPVPGKVPTAAQAAIAAPAVGLTALAITSKKKPETEGTFGEAFKAARKKGEGTKFTYKGKQYSAVTKDDLKRKGYKSNELKDYLNRKGKRKGLLSRILKPRSKPIKRSGKPGSRKMAKFKAGGAVMANRGLGKAYMKSKR